MTGQAMQGNSVSPVLKKGYDHMKEKKVTIKEVAALAGVSISSVSRICHIYL